MAIKLLTADWSSCKHLRPVLTVPPLCPCRIAVFSVTVLHDERIVIVAEQRPDSTEEDSFQWMSRVLQVALLLPSPRPRAAFVAFVRMWPPLIDCASVPDCHSVWSGIASTLTLTFVGEWLLDQDSNQGLQN